MGRLRLGSAVWLGMILGGSCLGVGVLAAWPEPTTHFTRLPYGESRPKTPSVTAERQAPAKRVVASVGVVKPSQPQTAPEEENVERELAGPPPVPSDSESSGYRTETPEELGAKPLPGMHPNAPAPSESPALEAAPTP